MYNLKKYLLTLLYCFNMLLKMIDFNKHKMKHILGKFKVNIFQENIFSKIMEFFGELNLFRFIISGVDYCYIHVLRQAFIYCTLSCTFSLNNRHSLI